MGYDNIMKLEFLSKSTNEGFARVSVAAFVSQLDPTIEELSEIKTAVSEAVTNSIVHAYDNELGLIYISAQIKDDVVTIQIKDKGKGINDVDRAKEPLFTTKPDLERSGMGFTIMESFMDKLVVKSEVNKGTVVTMSKRIKKNIQMSVHREKEKMM
jgi:stage II sporulation protein AB (anti-sigma F factor)